MASSRIAFPRELLLATTDENWDKLSNQDKRELLQSWENFMAKAAGRNPYRVEFKRLGSKIYGKTEPDKKTIYINFDSPFHRKLMTLFHEGRHAYQWQAVRGNIQHGDPTEVRIWDSNFKNYDEESPKYSTYAVEIDADKHRDEVFSQFWQQRHALIPEATMIEKAWLRMAIETPLSQIVAERRNQTSVYSKANFERKHIFLNPTSINQTIR